VGGRDLLPSNVLHIPMRAALVLATVLLGAVLAAPAQARLVYVKQPASASPAVYTADDDGKAPQRLGIGRSPAVSPDARWVAYVTVPSSSEDREELVLVPVAGGARRIVTSAKSINDLRFSPNSAQVAAIVGDRRVRIYDIASDRTIDTARGGLSEEDERRMLAAGVNPSARDRREFERMGTEKVVAFWESMQAMGLEVAKAQQQYALFALSHWWSPWVSPWSAAASATRVLEKGLGPVHRRASANVRRLRKPRRR